MLYMRTLASGAIVFRKVAIKNGHGRQRPAPDEMNSKERRLGNLKERMNSDLEIGTFVFRARRRTEHSRARQACRCRCHALAWWRCCISLPVPPTPSCVPAASIQCAPPVVPDLPRRWRHCRDVAVIYWSVPPLQTQEIQMIRMCLVLTVRLWGRVLRPLAGWPERTRKQSGSRPRRTCVKSMLFQSRSRW